MDFNKLQTLVSLWAIEIRAFTHKNAKFIVFYTHKPLLETKLNSDDIKD